MIGKPKDAGPTIAIGGIKFSRELVQVNIARETGDDATFTSLLHLISRQQINIPFISHSSENHLDRIAFCVDYEDFDRVESILGSSSFACNRIKFTKGVGTLTIFPHKNSLFLLGSIIRIFGKYHHPLYSLCTSISAIAINTDYLLLDQIVTDLEKYMQLPPNHAPFRQEFCLKHITK